MDEMPQDLTPFAILRPVVAPARLSSITILQGRPLRELVRILEPVFSERQAGDVMALDFETHGRPAELTTDGEPSRPVGVALSDRRGSLYIDFKSCLGAYEWLMRRLHTEAVPLIAHNLFFDGAWPLRDFGLWLNWQHCTYAVYKLCASEGWPGQSWGLKDAQRDVLGWADTNEKELDLWLLENGFIANTKKYSHEESGQPPEPGARLGAYLWMPSLADGEGRWASPQKGEMWRAPVDILGHYACLDADSTYLLYTQVLIPCLDRFAALKAYCAPDVYAAYIYTLIRQQLRGILIDREKLENYAASLRILITELKQAFLVHPDIAPIIAEYNAGKAAEHLAKEPEKFLKQKAPPPEPARYKKDGKESKAWTNWCAMMQDGERWKPVVSKNWEKWWAAHLELRDAQLFNLDSGPQKQWLFYEKLKHPVLLRTDTEQPAVDERALKMMGEPGRLLVNHNEKVKELSYVDACLGKIRADTQAVHPGVRVPGTLTGRLAGSGGLNIQQMPKTQGFLECWVARPGYRIVEFDFSAVEQVVLAELSKDSTLWKLYGPGAKKNDVYLFVGANLPGLGPIIRAAGYDPDNPTPEGIAAAKKACKKERQVAKIVTLGSSYGMGANKLSQTLRLEGIECDVPEAKRIHAGYWELYGGVKKYESELLRQFNRNRGWVLNGVGRPVGVADGYERDIVNRVVQSTAHDCLVLFLAIVAKYLDAAGIEWHPWIWDWHDEGMIEVPEAQAEQAARIIDGSALAALNEKLGGLIPLAGNSEIVGNLAAIKCTG